MKYFEESIGNNGAYAKYFLQDVTPEIDAGRIYPTIIICPGGGYLFTSAREEEVVAYQFLARGFHAIVLNYATEGLLAYQGNVEDFPKEPISQFPKPLVELAQVVSSVYENAVKWAVNTEYIVVGGFSAGGNLAAQLGVHWHENWLEHLTQKPKALYRPTHLLLCYPALEMTNNKTPLNVMLYAMTGKTKASSEELFKINPIEHITSLTPPSFVWHTREDMTVPVTDSIKYVSALEQHQVEYELHIFSKGKHGLSLADSRTGKQQNNINAQVSRWIDLFIEWLQPYKTQYGRFYEVEE